MRWVDIKYSSRYIKYLTNARYVKAAQRIVRYYDPIWKGYESKREYAFKKAMSRHKHNNCLDTNKLFNSEIEAIKKGYKIIYFGHFNRMSPVGRVMIKGQNKIMTYLAIEIPSRKNGEYVTIPSTLGRNINEIDYDILEYVTIPCTFGMNINGIDYDMQIDALENIND